MPKMNARQRFKPGRWGRIALVLSRRNGPSAFRFAGGARPHQFGARTQNRGFAYADRGAATPCACQLLELPPTW